MAAPYHGNTDFSIDDLDTGINDQNALNSLESIINNIDANGYTVSIDELVGSKTLENGGVLGDILELLRLHINDMKLKSELTSQMTGQVYSAMIQQALTSSIDFLYRSKDMQQLDKQRSMDLIKKMFDIEMSKLNNSDLQTKRKLDIFNLEFLKPLEHEQLVEQVEGLHVEHNIKQYELDELLPLDKSTKDYNLNSIMPMQRQLMDDDHRSKSKELDIRSYYNNYMQPIEKNILSEQELLQNKENSVKQYYIDNMQPIEKDILSDEHCLKSTDCEIKTYYKDNIQPEEFEITKKEVDLKAKEIDLRTEQIAVEHQKALIAEKDLELRGKELTLKDKEIDLATKELDLKQYEFDEMMPLRKQLLSNQSLLAGKQACVQQAECDIKNYYNDYIQPYEKDLAHAKAFQEEIMAGNYTADDSMPKKKIELMDTQKTLYERQTASYDDHKWQKLLETQTNYQSMIYADFVGVPEVLTYALNDHVKTVYNKLNPDDTIS